MVIEGLDFKADSTITSDETVYYSGNDFYGENGSPSIAYATLERDYWLLDGGKELLPASNFAVQPLIFKALSDANGNFSSKPTITISAESSGDQYNLIGLSFVFDTICEIYATNFDVECYLDGVLVDTINWQNDSVECNMDDTLDNFDKIKIIFNSVNKPFTRLRIERLMLGMLKTYSGNEIISANHKWTIDLLSREVTDTDFKVVVDNRLAEYNADNPNGVTAYFQEKQRVEIKYYYEITGGEYELVNGGILYLDGKPKTQEYQAELRAKGLLSNLNKVYKKGSYNANGVSFYNLLVNLFQEEGIDNYEIDSSLQNIATTIPLDQLSTRELIQIICNATNTICIEDRAGTIHITPKPTTPVNYYLDLANQKAFPVVETGAMVKDINVKYYQPELNSTSEELYKGTFKFLGTQTIHIDYSKAPAANTTATVTNATLDSATYYTTYCELVITSSSATTKIRVTVTGKPIDITENTFTMHVNDTGEDCEIANPLIDSEERALEVATYFKDYLQLRNAYTSDNRGEPAWDVADVIDLQTQFTEHLNVQIISNEISFDGGLSGKTEFRLTGGGS